ncbi:MAG TPA: hypothetical protein VOA80_11085, partial [Thermoanaerobaculia bacterium]|nr:hypothetical protein [Thermoanaerobaculia bacterium]
MIAEQVARRVVSVLQEQHAPCFLLEVPPGCEEPDVVAEVWRLVQRSLDLVAPCSYVTVNEVADEQDLVDLLIRGWLESDPALEDHWRHRRGAAAGLPTPLKLKAFVTDCVAILGRRRIALIGRFDKIFERMSSELLAVMLSLESSRLLSTINASPLDYQVLYQRRSRRQPGFTSDYGTTHAKLRLGALPRDEALRRWREIHSLPDPEGGRTAAAYFSTAFNLSGGLPVAFARAANLAVTQLPLPPDLRPYRAMLTRDLPTAFARLLRFDDEDARPRLIEAVARMHLGTAEVDHRRFVDDHRWRDLLLVEANGQLGQGQPGLRTEALGRMALELLRQEGSARSAEVTPERLYRHKEFKACCLALEQREAPPERLLFRAAQMLFEIFGDAPGNLYFGPEVRWHHIQQLAQGAAEAAPSEPSRLEFERWARIAGILGTAPSGHHLSGIARADAGREELENEAIRLAIRVMAVERDRNPVTAAYAAIPLIEDVLRLYVTRVLALPANGSAFTSLSEAQLQ